MNNYKSDSKAMLDIQSLIDQNDQVMKIECTVNATIWYDLMSCKRMIIFSKLNQLLMLTT